MSLTYFLYFIGIQALIIFCSVISAQEKDDFVPYEGQRYDSFDWQLLKALDSPKLGNVIVSPLSVKMVLAMLYEGASGATEKELEYTLQLPVSRQATRDRFQQIVHSLQTSSSDYTLDMGSRVFLDSTVTAEHRFRVALKAFYNTDVVSTNFDNKIQAREGINYWVSNITHGKVTNLVNEDDLQDASLLLANAMFFKGLWRTPFPRNKTTMGGFYLTPTQTVTVPYMSNSGRYYYSDSSELDAKILRLPFKGHFSMFIILPNSKAGLSRLIKDINPQILKRHLWLMDVHDVQVTFPRLKFEFNSKLGRLLQKLGLQQMFQNTASLAGIYRGSGKKLMVTNVIQKAGIEVNEEGSTAWAATGVTLGNKFGRPEYVFNASNPFLFYIEDEFTGTSLFVGKIENPAQVEQLPFPEDLRLPTRFAIPPETTMMSEQQPQPTPGTIKVVRSPAVR